MGWFNWDDGFLARGLAAAEGVVWESGEPVASLTPRDLAECGALSGFAWRGGRHCAEASELALLAAGRHDVVSQRYVGRPRPARGWRAALAAWAEDRDIVEAERLLATSDPWGVGGEGLALQAVGLANPAGARAAIELPGGAAEWRIEAAWTASRLLGDPELARRCLELAARDEPSPHLEDALARAHASLFSDLGGARRRLEAAERQSINDYWLRNTVAADWLRLLGDADAAERCLRTATRRAARSDQWLAAGQGWANLLSRQDEALRCYREARARARGGMMLSQVAEAVWDLDGDADALTQALRTAEEGVRELLDRIGLARVWKRLGRTDEVQRILSAGAARRSFDDQSSFAAAWLIDGADAARAGEVLTTGERAAVRGSQWVSLAVAWLDLLGDVERAQRALDRAEAVDPGDFRVFMAPLWLAVGEVDRARQTLARFETRVEPNPSDLSDLGRAQRMLGVSPTDARHPLERLAASADAEGLMALAEHYATWLGDGDAARTLLARAEARIEWAFSWPRLAEAYRRLLGDAAGARRCLDQVTEEASVGLGAEQAQVWVALGDTAHARTCLEAMFGRGEVYEQVNVAWAWMRLLADEAQARHCLQHASRRADDADAMARVAAGWLEILGDREESNRNLRRAEGVARDTADYLVVADQANDTLGDVNEGQRCFEAAQQSAKSSADWCHLAQRSWLAVEPRDLRRVQLRCLSRAETAAREARDWRYIADVWVDLMGDLDAAARCRERAAALPD